MGAAIFAVNKAPDFHGVGKSLYCASLSGTMHHNGWAAVAGKEAWPRPDAGDGEQQGGAG